MLGGELVTGGAGKLQYLRSTRCQIVECPSQDTQSVKNTNTQLGVQSLLIAPKTG